MHTDLIPDVPTNLATVKGADRCGSLRVVTGRAVPGNASRLCSHGVQREPEDGEVGEAKEIRLSGSI